MSKYHLIKKNSISDGIGVRVSIYLSGCKWHCKNCQNPMTWDENSGQEFTEETMNELYNNTNHSWINGITLTGGDPLHDANLDTVEKIINMVNSKLPNKDIWLYTGYEYDKLKKDNDIRRLNIINSIDVLVDGQYIEDLKDISYPYAGSTNQKIIVIKTGKEFNMKDYCLRK